MKRLITVYDEKMDFYFLKKRINIYKAILLTMGLSPKKYQDKVWNEYDVPEGYYELLNVIIEAIINKEITLSEIIYKDTEYTSRGKLKKNFNEYLIHPMFTEINQYEYVKWLHANNITKGYYERYQINHKENDFYKIPKNHKCVSVKTKALIETLLHFIENEQDLHDAKSGVSDAITKHIQDNNTYKISETSIKKEITPILNWTHQKELEKLK